MMVTFVQRTKVSWKTTPREIDDIMQIWELSNTEKIPYGENVNLSNMDAEQYDKDQKLIKCWKPTVKHIRWNFFEQEPTCEHFVETVVITFCWQRFCNSLILTLLPAAYRQTRDGKRATTIYESSLGKIAFFHLSLTNLRGYSLVEPVIQICKKILLNRMKMLTVILLVQSGFTSHYHIQETWV